MTLRIIASAVIAALLLSGSMGIQPQPTEVKSATQEAVTLEQAQQIALDHAGVTQPQQLEGKKDREKGTLLWDVEFRDGDWEYDYHISLEGQILHWNKEYDPLPAPKPTQPPTDPAPQEITLEQAKQIAMNHANLTEVTHFQGKKDREEGVLVWELEFRSGDWEYDYHITMEGKVLHWDKEYDPPKSTQPPTQPPTEPAPAGITRDQAKQIALAHAGVTQVRDLDIEKDRERGVTVWEVDFEADGWEYEYVIHGETGEILHWEKEFDD